MFSTDALLSYFRSEPIICRCGAAAKVHMLQEPSLAYIRCPACRADAEVESPGARREVTNMLPVRRAGAMFCPDDGARLKVHETRDAGQPRMHLFYCPWCKASGSVPAGR